MSFNPPPVTAVMVMPSWPMARGLMVMLKGALPYTGIESFPLCLSVRELFTMFMSSNSTVMVAFDNERDTAWIWVKLRAQLYIPLQKVQLHEQSWIRGEWWWLPPQSWYWMAAQERQRKVLIQWAGSDEQFPGQWWGEDRKPLNTKLWECLEPQNWLGFLLYHCSVNKRYPW